MIESGAEDAVEALVKIPSRPGLLNSSEERYRCVQLVLRSPDVVMLR